MTNICPTKHGNVQRFARLSNGFQVFENDGDSLSVVGPFLAFTLGHGLKLRLQCAHASFECCCIGQSVRPDRHFGIGDEPIGVKRMECAVRI